MAGSRNTRHHSLKREDGIWPGLERRSQFVPLGAGFQELKNCYVSKDGSEIRRIPGWGLIAEPIFSETSGITCTSEVAGSGKITFTMSGNHGIAVGDDVYIDDSAILTDGWYVVDAVPSATTFEVLTSETGSSGASFQLYPSRLKGLHSMLFHSGTICVVGQDKWQVYTGTIDVDHLAAWVSTNDLSFTTPATKFDYWPNPSRSASITDGSDFGDVLRRSTVELASGRVLVANHGYGCILEADLANATLEAGAQTLCACGPPKGLLFFDNEWTTPLVTGTHKQGNIASIAQSGANVLITLDMNHGQAGSFAVTLADIIGPDSATLNGAHTGTVVAANSFTIPAITLTGLNRWGFSNPPTLPSAMASGTYFVAAAYQYIHNGELGLISDIAKFTVTASQTRYIDVHYANPREALREAPTACEVLVFAGTSQNDLRLVERRQESSTGLGPTGSPIQVTDSSIPAADESRQRVPRLELAPMGAKAMRTLRGYTFYGGTYAFAGPNENHEQIKTESWPNNDYGEQVADAADKHLVVNVAAGDNINVGAPILPAGYQGVSIHNPPNVNRSWARLESLTAMTNGTGSNNAQQWRVAIDTLPKGTSATGQLLLPKGHVWFSEREHPEVVPATNRLVADLLEGRDVEALGRAGDALIVCTNKETYRVGFGRSPLGTDPALLSDEFGCIAPRTMVEFDGGLFWVSERGPVVSTGGPPEWIGQHIFDDETEMSSLGFVTCDRDKKGMMHHAFAAHDPERGLVWLGVSNSASYSALSENNKTLAACDFFYIWSYRSNAWSTWEPPAHLEGIYDMDLVTMDDGVERLAFLAGSGDKARIYAFDDEYYDSHKYATLPTGTVDVAASSENTFVTTSAIPDALTGMGYIVKNAAGTKVKAFGEIPGTPTHGASSSTFTIPGYSVIETGDTITVGLINIQIATAAFTLSEPDRLMNLRGIEARHSAVHTNSGERRFLQAQVSSEGSNTSVSLAPKTAGVETGVELSAWRATAHEGGFRDKDAEIIFWIYGDGLVRLKDLFVEEGYGG